MIYSMTGFGKARAEDEQRKVTVEIKGVNHRYLDISMKLPRRLSSYEIGLRTRLKKEIVRGKVDVLVLFEDASEGVNNLLYHKDIAMEYIKAFNEMETSLSIKNDISVSGLSLLPEVFTIEQTYEEDDSLEALLNKAFDLAVKAFKESRAKEGGALADDILSKLSVMSGYADQVENKYPDIVSAYKERLHQKLAEVAVEFSADDARLAQEVVIYADKICVDEEIVRLKTHIKAMADVLEKGGEAGRKLDFIAQEMNRESNTILSKSQDAKISDLAIELKTDVEKIREQVQNIE